MMIIVFIIVVIYKSETVIEVCTHFFPLIIRISFNVISGRARGEKRVGLIEGEGH